MVKTSPTSVILPKDVKKALEYECNRTGRTKTEVIIDALIVYFTKGKSVKGILFVMDGGDDAKEAKTDVQGQEKW